jgi:cyclophilin family peptidyl-prolyl cis-trans isomerase
MSLRAVLVALVALALVTACGGPSAASRLPSQVAPSQVVAGSPPDVTPLAEAPAEPAGSGLTATLHTGAGDMVLELYDLSAPVATANFTQLARSGFYDGVVFHRILPGFMIQGGDPTGTGMGGPGYTIPDEPFAGDYVPGVVAMARTPQPDSSGSQFFIVVGDASHLEHVYTIFGRVASGMDVAQVIAAGPRGGPQDDQAMQPVAIDSIEISGG